MNTENAVSTAIVRQYSQKLIDHLCVDVAIVGAGPSALVAARYLRKAGVRVAIFERQLAPGGGVWGGGMLFNEVLVQDDAVEILEEFGIGHIPVEDSPGYQTVDSVEMAGGLIFGAVRSGAKIFNSVSVEDIIFKEDRVGGLVINWTTVMRLGLFVDPLTIVADTVLDATGHPSVIMNLAVNKAKIQLKTPTGGIMGERPMWVDRGEESAVESAGEYYPGLFACGMSSNNVMGGYRMGPIFGGMLKSGRKVAELILARRRAE
ncbi:MAG: sulfide-dependent adenosine diphosphate thiazole synthase [Planctomycetia bacterium]|nr:sulfide-dependent adenosine diphosphate thiazole synthase [Planctomycetia bacterium]